MFNRIRNPGFMSQLRRKKSHNLLAGRVGLMHRQTWDKKLWLSLKKWAMSCKMAILDSSLCSLIRKRTSASSRSSSRATYGKTGLRIRSRPWVWPIGSSSDLLFLPTLIGGNLDSSAPMTTLMTRYWIYWCYSWQLFSVPLTTTRTWYWKYCISWG